MPLLRTKKDQLLIPSQRGQVRLVENVEALLPDGSLTCLPANTILWADLRTSAPVADTSPER